MIKTKPVFSFLFRSATIAIFIIIGTFIAINIFDSDLNPEVKEIINAELQNIVTENNAYFQLIGLHTSNDNISKAGLNIFNHASSSDIPTDYLLSGIKFVRGNVSNNCFFEMDYLTACTDYVKKHSGAIKTSINTNKYLLAHYQVILDEFEQYIEPMHAQEIYWQRNMLPLHRLYLSSLIVQAYEQSSSNYTSRQLTDNIIFWRKILGNTYSLKTKMVAVSALKSNYKILFELLYSCGNCDKYLSKSVTQPLTSEELDLDAVLNNEFIHLVKTLEKKDRDSVVDSSISNLFYNHNKVINSIYKMYSEYTEAAQYSHLDGPNKAAKTMDKYRLKSNFSWATLFYNPTGKIYAAANVPSTYNYKLRLIQLDQQIAALRAYSNQFTNSSTLKEKQTYLQNSTELIGGLKYTIERYNHGHAARKDVAEVLQHLAKLTRDAYFENQYQYWTSGDE